MSKEDTVTVNELIRLLEKHPPGLRVMVQGYEDGHDDLEAKCVVAGEARLDVHSAWYYGRHEQALRGDEPSRHEIVPALFLHRPWHDRT